MLLQQLRRAKCFDLSLPDQHKQDGLVLCYTRLSPRCAAALVSGASGLGMVHVFVCVCRQGRANAAGDR